MTLPARIAFCGYARCGKDEAAKPLYALGYQRRCFGDIIKGDLDEIVKKHLGFSAFTEDIAQKEHIRPLLEQYGEVFYDSVLSRFITYMPEKAVNTRLVKVREATAFKDIGGMIYEIVRPYTSAATEWECLRLGELRQSGLIAGIIVNDGTQEELHQKILAISS